MQLSFKLCTTSDLERLVDISRITYYDSFRADNSAENMKEYLDSSFGKSKLAKELKNKDSEFYFAYSGDSIIGYFKINSGQAQTDIRDKSAIELERFYVHKEFQGINLGQKLIDKAIEIAKSKDAEYIWLGVWEKNIRAIRFYKKNGFVKFGEHAFMMGKDKQTDHLMKLNL